MTMNFLQDSSDFYSFTTSTMGTNYYLYYPLQNICDACGRSDEIKPLHIGKSSLGWCFGLHVYPEKDIHDLDDWIVLFKQFGNTIKNEYGDTIKHRDMQSIIVDRCRNKDWNDEWWNVSAYTSEEDFHDKNHSQRGPKGLLRHRINQYCIKHGVGTWDCMIGEFS